MMIRVGFHSISQALVIEGYDVFPARSLTLHDDEDEVGYLELWSLAGRSERRGHWQEFGPLQGDGFASKAETVAYLLAEFAKPEQRGDTFALPIAIAAIGQTTIPLDVPPTRLSTLRVEVNGVTYRAPEIAASDVAVTWLNGDFPLDPSDSVTVVYS